MFAGRLTKSKAEKICRYYFYAGFLGLPFLWAIVALTFYPYRAASESVRFYVSISSVLALISIALFAVWVGIVYGALRTVDFIWIIQPDATVKQTGLFASEVYNAGF